jgi:hypothetical protein
VKEGVVDSPLIPAAWISKRQSYDSCRNNSRCMYRFAICILVQEYHDFNGIDSSCLIRKEKNWTIILSLIVNV